MKIAINIVSSEGRAGCLPPSFVPFCQVRKMASAGGNVYSTRGSGMRASIYGNFNRKIGRTMGNRGLRVAVTAQSTDKGPAIMVNSCTGKMGHATAEAVIRAGLPLIPFSFTGRSEAVAVGNVGVCGVPVELVSPSERQEALDRIRQEYKDLVIVDYTLPSAVNGKFKLCPHLRK